MSEIEIEGERAEEAPTDATPAADGAATAPTPAAEPTPAEEAAPVRERPTRWYVVHTYSGFEAKVKASLDERRRGELTKKKAELAALQAKTDRSDRDQAQLEATIKAVEQLDSFHEVLVPAEKVVELVKGNKRTSTRKFFPGYILINVGILGRLPEGVHQIDAARDRLRRRHRRPARDQRVRGARDHPADGGGRDQAQAQGALRERRERQGDRRSVPGLQRRRRRGSRPDKGKLRVLISIFGRATPVELDFVQVEKA